MKTNVTSSTTAARALATIPRLSTIAALTLVGCGADVGFAMRYAPEFRRDATTLSVFGVYKDGRMSADAWTDLAPRFAGALGAGCEPAFGEALLARDRALAEAIDEGARADGVTDQLLSAFAPAASGDAILVVTVSGESPAEASSKPSPTTTPGALGPPNRGGGRLRGGGGGYALPEARPPSVRAPARSGMEMAAALYSVRAQKTVAVVAMKYTGKHPDEAVAAFVDKLRAELPGARCAGWKPDVKIEPGRIRAALE